MKFWILGLGFCIGLCLFGIFLIGWYSNEFYTKTTKINQYDGMRFGYSDNYTDVIKYVQSFDNQGDWVCINVKGMSFERGLEVCNHEMGHEIFAEYCENNINKCMDIIK